MNSKSKIILGVSALGVIGVILLLTTKYKVKKVKQDRMLNEIADEGYETAGDILFPLKTKGFRSANAIL